MKPPRLNSEERRAAFALLSVDARHANELRESLQSGLRWPLFFDSLEGSGVLPTIAWTLSKGGLLDALPPSWAEHASAATADAAARNALLLTEVGRVVGPLEAAGISSIVLKGVALLSRHYPSAAARHTDDIDVLIEPGCESRAVDPLCAAGFELVEKSVSIAIDGSSTLEFIGPRHHEFAQLASPSGILVELHVLPPGERRAPETAFAELLSRTERAELGGVSVAIPDGPSLFEQICDHVVAHHLARPHYLPRHLADVDVLSQRGVRPQRETFSTRFSHALHAAVCERKGGRLANALRDIVFPAPWVDAGWSRATYFSEMVQRLWFDVRHRPGVLRYKVLPARRYMAATYGVAEDSPALYALYLKRLASIPFKVKA